MTRRIVQIAATPAAGHDRDTRFYPALYALADDGSVWVMYSPEPGSEWEPVPPLPQSQDGAA